MDIMHFQIDNLIPNFIWKIIWKCKNIQEMCKNMRIAKEFKEYKIPRITLQDIKTFCKATVIIMTWYCTSQNNCTIIQNSKCRNKSKNMRFMIKVDLQSSREKNSLFQKWFWVPWLFIQKI